MEQKKSNRGGARPNSGRPRKDPDVYVQVTCVLRRDTVQKLREGCGGASKHFGQFLQDHLDEHPLPSRKTYLALLRLKELKAKGIYSNSAWDKEVRRLRREERKAQREAKRLAAMSPKERAQERNLIKFLRAESKKDAARAKKEAAAA